MNDPHVVALTFKVRRFRESGEYGEAKPLEHDEEGFRLELKDGTARFEMKEHHATAPEARKVVEPFVRNWEFDALVGQRHEHFHLDSHRPEIIDRSPTKDVMSLSAHARTGPVKSSTNLAVRHGRYPSPPTSDIDAAHPDARTLDQRYRMYRDGREELPGFAYLCLTVLEYPFTPPQGGKRDRAAACYSIDVNVLQRIGELSSTKGGIAGARKREGVDDPLTDEERRFLERATVRLIRRVAERRATNGDLPRISMGDVS